MAFGGTMSGPDDAWLLPSNELSRLRENRFPAFGGDLNQYWNPQYGGYGGYGAMDQYMAGSSEPAQSAQDIYDKMNMEEGKNPTFGQSALASGISGFSRMRQNPGMNTPLMQTGQALMESLLPYTGRKSKEASGVVPTTISSTGKSTMSLRPSKFGKAPTPKALQPQELPYAGRAPSPQAKQPQELLPGRVPSSKNVRPQELTNPIYGRNPAPRAMQSSALSETDHIGPGRQFIRALGQEGGTPQLRPQPALPENMRNLSPSGKKFLEQFIKPEDVAPKVDRQSARLPAPGETFPFESDVFNQGTSGRERFERSKWLQPHSQRRTADIGGAENPYGPGGMGGFSPSMRGQYYDGVSGAAESELSPRNRGRSLMNPRERGVRPTPLPESKEPSWMASDDTGGFSLNEDNLGQRLQPNRKPLQQINQNRATRALRGVRNRLNSVRDRFGAMQNLLSRRKAAAANDWERYPEVENELWNERGL